MVSFSAYRTHWINKESGDPWVIAMSEQSEKLQVSKWKAGDTASGWLGDGFLKVGFKASGIKDWKYLLLHDSSL